MILGGYSYAYYPTSPTLMKHLVEPRSSPAYLTKEAGVDHAIASTTLTKLMIQDGHEPPVKLGSFFRRSCP